MNGQMLGQNASYHQNGYTSFWHRIDRGNLFFGGKNNAIAVFANAAPGTGGWYQGGGIIRHVTLVHAPNVFLPPDETWASAEISEASLFQNGPLPADGAIATGTVIHVRGTIANGADVSARGIRISVTLQGQSGEAVEGGTATQGPFLLAGHNDMHFNITWTPTGAMQIWSVSRPYLYKAIVTVTTEAEAADIHTVSFGVRTVRFDPDLGMYLNGKHLKMRGMCDHSTFGGVGAAMPDRVQLFKAQTLREAGVNACEPSSPHLPNALLSAPPFLIVEAPTDVLHRADGT